MAVIHVLELTVPAPPRYPHIYPLLFSVYSAVQLGLLLVYMNLRQLLQPESAEAKNSKLSS